MSNAKLRVQVFGRFLSNMVMPNIGAFIAWGFITALFIPVGWSPNELLAKLVSPMVHYMLPLLIGFQGGKIVAGERGGVVGAIATMGVIVGSEQPMFIGAMMVGPFGGYIIGQFDRMVAGRVKSGFEMLVNNFSAGILGALMAGVAMLVVSPVVESFSAMLSCGVRFMLQHDLLPLTSLLVEPAKIFFLNNAINHGIFSPLGIQRSAEAGQSLFFLIESNPGPGLGVLLAYLFFGKSNARDTASGAAIIHFFGGIHEIYFPYVLMMPQLLIALILGGATGIATLLFFQAGLVSPPSPGSIFAILLMTPKDSAIGVVAAVASASIVSFLCSSLIMRVSAAPEEGPVEQKQVEQKQVEQKQEALAVHSEEQAQNLQAQNFQNSENNTDARPLTLPILLVVACDAGMGSSAMGASILRKQVEGAGVEITEAIEVTNCAINDLPENAYIVITHSNLTQRARTKAPNSKHISLDNFLDSKFYQDLVTRVSHEIGEHEIGKIAQNGQPTREIKSDHSAAVGNCFQLSENDILLDCAADDKYQAIRFVGEQMVKNGYVTPDYIDAMLARENESPTYLGETIAVPHGTIAAKEKILQTGVVFCQYPQGVLFGEQKDEVAKLVFGIAARNNEHLKLITTLTNALDNPEIIRKLSTTRDKREVLRLLAMETKE